MISNEKLKSILDQYGQHADDRCLETIARYIALLLRWNKKIALTTVTNEEEIVRFHFGESIFALSAVPITNGRLADVGTGPGFPGMALAIFCKELEVTLIESNLKKAAFLNELVRELAIKNVLVVGQRMENCRSIEHFNFVCARALGNYSDFLDWGVRSLSADGKVVLWLVANDANEIKKDGRFSWDPQVEIPSAKQRVLLIGSKAH